MRSVKDTRKKLCHTIASLDVDASREEVSRTLDPILISWNDEAQDLDQSDCGDGVTPLIVACDKANEQCIEYIASAIKEKPFLAVILGHPLDKTLPDQNTAMHHAALSGCVPAIRCLVDLLDNEAGGAKALASQRNENIDTPIMMAAKEGHTEFLQELRQVLLHEQGGTTREIRQLFELKNRQGDTALLFACVHGRVRVVNAMLDEIGVNVSHHHVEACMQTVKRIDAMLQLSSKTPDDFRKRRSDVYRCLVTLKVAQAKAAEKATEKLLAEEEAEEAERKANQEKHERRKRVHALCMTLAKREGGDASQDHETGNANKSSAGEGVDAESIENKEFQHDRNDNGQEAARETPENDSDSTESNDCDNTGANDIFVSDAYAVMEALCLDVNMLLLSPREMAATMSASQLDAIGEVLRDQLAAVEQAREIQSKLRDQM